ncbi:hypothetical protein [Bordetella sp. N]|uniref:hypothetical protein n=1 Tax=Bordetella sp. N TaxID=1746199 RepID=UPI00070FF5BF|nr:hypothetical protein [Bordetella sp. N]ALM83585.1 hypothetical protein ASB57_11940 [Bordetella sp. N]
MTPWLDLELLFDLYPDTATRNDFLRRAWQVLSADRMALSAALERRDHGEARQLAHRIQGTTAFLNGARERTVELFGALNQGLAQSDVDQITAACGPVLTYLSGLETALLSAAAAPGGCRNAWTEDAGTRPQ